jgi:putative transposase
MVARQHRRVVNQRRDLLHTLTTTVVRAHDAVCIETLTLRAMARTKLAKSVQDAAISLMFFMLRYKTVWQRGQPRPRRGSARRAVRRARAWRHLW